MRSWSLSFQGLGLFIFLAASAMLWCLPKAVTVSHSHPSSHAAFSYGRGFLVKSRLQTRTRTYARDHLCKTRITGKSTDDASEDKVSEGKSRKAWEESKLIHLEEIRKQIFLVESLLEDFPGNVDLTQQLKQLKSRYPLYAYEKDLEDALYFNFNQAAKFLALKRLEFLRKLRYPSQSTMRVCVLRKKGDTLTLYRANGQKIKRFKPRLATTGEGQARQFQNPTFSPDGKFLAASELLVENGRILAACVCVWSRTSSNTYDRVFESAVPSTPFYIRFTPDGNSLCLLVNSKNGRVQIWKIDFIKYVGNKDDPEFVRLMEGSSTFFTFTTSNPGNYSLVAHNPDEGGVFVLKKSGWQKISTGKSSTTAQWRTPQCHSAGGGDSVCVVEDSWVVSRSLVKWKGSVAKRLLPVKGQVYISVSPDHGKCAILQHDIDKGGFSCTMIVGEDSLDPASESPVEKFEVPTRKLVLGLFFSPDSRKVLCLCLPSSPSDLASARNAMRLGQSVECQWAILDIETRTVTDLEIFKPSQYYTKTYLPFFDSFCHTLCHWAPDSNSFVYMTADGVKHTHITPGRGLGKQWIMPDVEVATWSWN